MPEEHPEHKIDGLEALFMVGLCAMFDLIDFGASFLDVALGAGEFVKIFNNVIASSVIFFWAMMKGVRPTWTLVGGFVEFIPLVNALPIRTGTMIATIIAERSREKLEAHEGEDEGEGRSMAKQIALQAAKAIALKKLPTGAASPANGNDLAV